MLIERCLIISLVQSTFKHFGSLCLFKLNAAVLVMKILIATFTFSPEANGVSMVVGAHAEGLLNYGHDVTISTGWDARRGESRVIPGKPTIVQFKVSGNANLRRGCKGEIEEYRRFLLEWEGDLIFFHAWGIWSTDLAIKLLPKLKAKKIMVSHGLAIHRYTLGTRFPKGFISWLGWQPYVWNLTNIMRKYDRVVFLSELENHLSFYDRLLANRAHLVNLTVIPNGVNLSDFSRNKNKTNFREKFLPGNSLMVLCVSNYYPEKNQLLALKAFKAANVPESKLVFIGGEFTGYSERLKAETQRLGLEESVLILEKIERKTICDAYRAADVFILPSLHETAPLVILEAMASGTAFVSTEVGWVPTLPGGKVVADEEQMGFAIRELLNSPKLRAELGEAGRLACESRFNWSAIAEAYHTLATEVIGTMPLKHAN